MVTRLNPYWTGRTYMSLPGKGWKGHMSLPGKGLEGHICPSLVRDGKEIYVPLL